MVRRIDWLIFLSVLVLTGLGLLAIWSVDLSRDPEFLNFKKQLVFAAVGLVLAVVLTLMDWRALRALARPAYILGALLLVAVLVFGQVVRGTRGWFGLGNWTFQPVELAKILLLLGLAKYFSVKAQVVDFKVLSGSLALTALYVGLVVLQPDLGSALLLVALWVGLLCFTKIRKPHVLAFVALTAVVALGSWFFVLKDYQKDRITSFLNPEADPFGRGYNIRQSVIAVGAGGVFGRGLGEGSQSQLRFLPEAHTDFVFAVLAEQLGLVVVLILLGAYGVLMWRLVALTQGVQDGFALFVLAGVATLWLTQIVFNIGMNMGLLPIAGLPLPFVSYGGSALLANFILLGVVQSIKVRG